MSTAFLGLGSNEGERPAHLQRAVAALYGSSEVNVIRVSPVYETEAHTLRPGDSQEAYLNAVVQVETSIGPEKLLSYAQELEREAGRSSNDRRWGPRPLDVDLLAYDGVTRSGDRLTLPHPRLANRRFVLRPWADIAPTFVVPAPFDESVRALLERCPDTAAVHRTDHRIGSASKASDG